MTGLGDALPQMEKMGEMQETLTLVVTHVASFFIIFGGIVPYIPQYLDIRRTKNAEGFSLFVCFVLLVANVLRILFWFGRHFETPLLLQSIVMIITMFAMVHICTVVKAKSEIVTPKPKVFSDSESSVIKDKEGSVIARGPSSSVSPTQGHPSSVDETRAEVEIKSHRSLHDFDSRHFWRWTDFYSYVEFMTLLSTVIGAVTYFLLDVKAYVETLGFLAVFFEAMLGAPQFYKNFQNRSTKGMSIKMVLMWTSGDVFKTVYFLLRNAPMQFWICGMLQVSLDVAILSQVFYYGLRKPAVQ